MISLMHGDFLHLLNHIPDESIDLILTDIPFMISRKSSFDTMKNRRYRRSLEFGEWDKAFDEQMLCHLQRKLKKGGSLVTFHSMEQYTILQNVFTELIFKDKMVWEKTNPMPRNRDRRYVSNIEIASWFVKPGNKWTFHRQNASYDGCVMKYPSESGGGFKRYHPCQKSQGVLVELLKRHSNDGDVVFDPFMGSGSTGVACITTGRNFIGIEKDEKYFETAERRILQAQLHRQEE